jgi:hypothetical protein
MVWYRVRVIARRGRATKIALSVHICVIWRLVAICAPAKQQAPVSLKFRHTIPATSSAALPYGMAKKSSKGAPAAASRSISKRPASDTPTRQSKRARATTKKSYAEPTTEDDETTVKKANSSPSEEDNTDASAFEEEIDEDLPSDSGLEQATSDEDSSVKRATSRGRSAKKEMPLRKKQANEKELWRPGAKLEPGTQLIIR